MSHPTPVMQQYNEAKAECPHALLLFRMGDFYEAFDEDAEATADVLGLAITRRGKRAMAGFPHHSLDRNIGHLQAAGHQVSVAIPTFELFPNLPQ